ncbi:DUF1722 domain-containing protein [Enterococcus sp. AZ109]|uniref:DUF1722 domain-containing protein n=1 Tax=Enterococcus sp. AZ109 TaxID=2774634 RepID=UPI003F206F1F
MNLQEAQKQWASWKYYVMARSQKEYLALRALFSGNQWSEEKERQFYETLKLVQQLPPNPKAMRNAYEHIWGYFKKAVTKEERAVFYTKLTQLSETNDEALPYLRYLNDKYPDAYLSESELFKESNQQTD